MGEDLQNPKYLDLAEFNARLQRRPGSGRRVWRSLEELADTDAFRDLVHREFPKAASEWDDGHSRRDFLKLMGASLALAGVTAGGCAKRRDEKIVPYVQQPEQVVPGRPLYFASAMVMNGFGNGVLVEQHEGRPTKIEGNPDHPASLGATNVWMQASVLQLYDPDRSQAVMRAGLTNSWGTFLDQLQDLLQFDLTRNKTDGLERKPRKQPARVRILTEAVTSPTLAEQIGALQSTLPGLQWHVYDPVGRDNTLAGAKLAFGRELAPVYRFDRAKVILSIDGNFLMDDPGSVRYARDFARSRGIDGIRRPIDSSEMARLYAVESTSTITGTKADHRLRLPPDEVQSVAREIARALGTGGETGAAAESPSTGPSTRPAESSHASAEERKHRFVQTVVADLRRAGAAAVVVAGECQPPEIHALAYAMNQTLGSVGNGDDKPVSFIKPPEANVANGVESLRDLLSAMDAGQVDLLLILGGNPAYTAPADLRFGERLKAFTDQLRPDGYPGWSVHLGEYFDETSLRCQWHLPEAHFLESWGDVRAYDGTACIVQPLISPLYQGRTASEVLASVLDRLTTTAGRTTGAAATQPGSAGDQPTGATGPTTRGGEAVVANTGYEVLRAFWRKQVGEKNFEQWWQKTLARGVIEGTAYKSEQPSAQADLAALLNAPVTRPAAATTNPSATQPGGSIRVVFRPDPSVWDGRFSNNAWLQELPKPLTKLVWDNAVILSPNTARALGFAEELPANLTKTGDSDELHKVNGRLVSLTVGDRHLDGVPVWILPGHPDNVATLYFGYGRERLGRVANGMGFNAYALRTSANLWTAPNAEIKVQPGRYALATTQSQQVIDTGTNENRELVRHGTSADEIFEHVVQRLPIAEQPAARKAFQDQKNAGSRVSLPVIPDLEARMERGTATDPGLPRSLYPGAPDQGTSDGSHNANYPAWAMVIDLTACIGCNACVVACQSENNIPVVGKDQVLAQRNMHWIRIDTYFETEESDPASISDPETHFQPVPCMHCEKAPCEVVCPVAATSHSVEGLNEMTYNRCVGTRYCSNNCPYKVRRFNFLQYSDTETPVLKLMRNPDVSVRNRGVMEKCSYCVQRISHARIESKKLTAQAAEAPTPQDAAKLKSAAHEAITSVVSACAQACPTQAIVFGNINPADNPPGGESQVYQLKRMPTNYGLLDEELQTRPRTTYLAKIDNPAPGAAEGGNGGGAGGGHGAGGRKAGEHGAAGAG